MKFEMQHVEPQGFVEEAENVGQPRGLTDTAIPIHMAPHVRTLAWWPVTVFCAAVDGYFEAFFACFSHEDQEGRP